MPSIPQRRSPPAAAEESGRSSLRSLGAWSLVLATYWAALAVATHLPPRAVPQTNLPDKFLHYVAYAGLTALLLIRLHVGGRLNGRTLLITIAIVATWGAIDELLQTPFGRTCDLYDWLADMIGCLTVAIAALVFGWLRRFRAGT